MASNKEDFDFERQLKRLTRKKLDFPDSGDHEENYIKSRDFPHLQSEFLFPPIPISSLPSSLLSTPVQEYAKQIKVPKFNPFDVKCPISKMIIDYDLKIMEISSTLTPEQPVIKKDLKCLKYVKREKTTLRQLCCNFNTRAAKEKQTIDKFGSIFNGTKDSPRMSWSVKFHGKEGTSICILKGFDERLGPNSSIMPPTAMHKCSVDDIRNYLKRINVKPCKEKLKDCEISFDYIIYYMTNSLWKFGYIYWIVEEDSMIYLYDLTSSFQMIPYVIDESSSLNKDERLFSAERSAAKNAIGLLYYHTARQCYLDNREKHYHNIKEMCLRAVSLIERNANPLEFCMTTIIRDKTIIPNNTEFENPLLLCVYESGKVYYKKTKKPSDDTSVVEELAFTIEVESAHLTNCLEFHAKRLYDKKKLPYNATWKNEFNKDLNELIKDLLPAKIMHVEVSSLKESIMDKFMMKYEDDWEFRMVVYLLRKLYHELVVMARLHQKLKRFGSAIILARESVKVWHNMVCLLSPNKQLPLPLMPLVMLGEIFHLYSTDTNTARKECLKYNIEGLPEWSDAILPIIADTLEDRRCVFNYPDSKVDCQLPFLKLSLEFFVRTLLYTKVEPTKELLQHVCHVMNEISYLYLLRCDEEDASYQSHSVASEILKSTTNIIKVTKIVANSINDKKNLILALCNNARYMRYKYFYGDFAQEGKHLVTKVSESYKKVFKEYEAALNFAEENRTYCRDCVGIIVWEYTEALDEYCIMHRKAEKDDREFYNKEILRKYETILILAKKYKSICACLEYKLAYGSASIAEYLFGLYINTDLEDLRTAFIMWYEEANDRFEEMSNQKAPIEQLKLILELAKYYENAAIGLFDTPLSFQECYKNQYMTLMMCETPMIQLKSISFRNPWDGETSETRTARNKLIDEYPKQVVSQLQEALKKRIILFSNKKDLVRIDFTLDQAKDIYRLTCYIKGMCVIEHLTNVLPKINDVSTQYLSDNKNLK